MLSDGAHPVWVGDGRTAEFLNDQGHGSKRIPPGADTRTFVNVLARPAGGNVRESGEGWGATWSGVAGCRLTRLNGAVFSSRLDDSYSVEVRNGVAPLTLAKVGANSAVRFAPPFIATIASGLDVSLTTLGGAIAVGELVGLSGPLVARVAGGLTRRSAMWIGLLGIALGASVSATATTAVHFAIGLALMTLSKTVFDLGIIGWVTDRVAYAEMGRVIGLTETAWAGSLLVGVVLMGLLTGLTSWRWGYVLAIVAIVILAAVLQRRLPNEVRPPRISRAEHRDRAPLGAGWLVIIAALTLTASSQAVVVTFGKWLENDFDFSATQVAAVVFGLGGVELLAASAIVRFADTWGKQRSTMFGALAIVPAGVVLSLVNTHLAISLIVLAVYICAFEFSIVATLSLATSLVPNRPTTGLGMMVGAATLGRAVMAPPATAAYTSHGMTLVAAIGASCAAVSFACQWRYGAVRAAKSNVRQPA